MGQRRQQMARGRLIFLAVVLVSLAQRSTSKALPPNPNPTQTPTATSTPTSTPTDPAEICSICTDACPTHLANYKKMNCCWSMMQDSRTIPTALPTRKPTTLRTVAAQSQPQPQRQTQPQPQPQPQPHPQPHSAPTLQPSPDKLKRPSDLRPSDLRPSDLRPNLVPNRIDLDELLMIKNRCVKTKAMATFTKAGITIFITLHCD